SMYPAIMVQFNVSPETVGCACCPDNRVPEIGYSVCRQRRGLVPLTLQPLLEKRMQYKRMIKTMPDGYTREVLRSRQMAQKWLLVCCFGYLGYKNARFGRIESHEAVTAYGRECLLRAKEAAEDLGFNVLHMYVDALWVQRAGATQPDFATLLEAITARTGLPIALEGIYRWVAFLPSKVDGRVPVANRYFGIFQSGEFKKRGIEARQANTAPFVGRLQNQVLAQMARVPDGQPLAACLPAVKRLFDQTLIDLKEGRIPPEQLLVSQRLSRQLADYRVPSHAARAAHQLQAAGKELRPGQRVRFVYTHGARRVHAWDAPQALQPAAPDIAYYTELMLRAMCTVLYPLGLAETTLRSWLLYGVYQLSLFLPA
ncbi:MAG: hypothetical protein KC441_17205, partial [Anaerolineales bacterium]|nr:hypothetical protein [Anaerolineales bacterium]